MASTSTHNPEQPPTEQATNSPLSIEETWYQCDKCAFETRQEPNLNWHKYEHTTDVDAGEIDCYKCGKCDFQCKCILDFEKHFSFVHCHHCNVKDNPKDVFDWDFRDISGAVELAKIFFHLEVHHFGTETTDEEQCDAQNVRVVLFRDALKSVHTRMFGHDPYFDCNLNEFMSFYLCRMMLPCNCMPAEVKCALRRTMNRAREDNVDFFKLN